MAGVGDVQLRGRLNDCGLALACSSFGSLCLLNYALNIAADLRISIDALQSKAVVPEPLAYVAVPSKMKPRITHVGGRDDPRLPWSPNGYRIGWLAGWGAITMAARSNRIVLRTKVVYMCRNIRPLFNFEPPASEEEIRASALQFVRKVSGFAKPSHANAEAFDHAVDEVTEAARRLIFSLQSAAPPRDRETEARKARERSRLRYG